MILNPGGCQMDNALKVAHIWRAAKAGGVFPDAGQAGFRVPEQQTEEDGGCHDKIFNHVPVVMQEANPVGVTNWFHAVQKESCKLFEDMMQMCENADWERNAVANEDDYLQKQLDD